MRKITAADRNASPAQMAAEPSTSITENTVSDLRHSAAPEYLTA